jgi:hypothetical protein
MKTLALITIYVLSFICIFYILSLIGVIFTPYEKIITNDVWRTLYAMFFGWWLAIFPAREMYVYCKWDLGF